MSKAIAIAGFTGKMARLITSVLGDLYRRIQSTFKNQPENEFAWIGMFYQYYMQNGNDLVGQTRQRALPNRSTNEHRGVLERTYEGDGGQRFLLGLAAQL